MLFLQRYLASNVLCMCMLASHYAYVGRRSHFLEAHNNKRWWDGGNDMVLGGMNTVLHHGPHGLGMIMRKE